jgi:aquaporin Z
MHKILVEAIGTFFLVLVIGLTVIAPGAGNMAPLAIGAMLMVMVYAGGPISGAHYNPAVTLAVWLRGKCPAKDVLPYIGAQMGGAVLAAFAATALKQGSRVSALHPDPYSALLVEFLFTFVLAFVVLNVSTSKKAAGNSYFGLAIGLTLTAAAYAGGNISGGAFNPAVAVAAALMGLGSASSLWLVVIGNLAGGVVAARVFRAVNPGE